MSDWIIGAASHVLRGTRGTLAIVFSGGPAVAGVTVEIRNEAGDVVAEGDADQDGSTARYTFALEPQTALGPLKVDWSGTWDNVDQTLTTWVEIVGSQLFTIAELRAFGGEPSVASMVTYPDELVAAYRDRVEDYFRDRSGVSFTKRGRRVVLDGSGIRPLPLPLRDVTKVVSVTLFGRSFTDDELAQISVDQLGRLRWIPYGGTWGNIRGSVVVDVEHGYDSPPAQIKYAAMILARRELVTTDVDDRAVTLSNDLGTIRLSVPGPNFPTGIPVVDQALDDYSPEMVIA